MNRKRRRRIQQGRKDMENQRIRSWGEAENAERVFSKPSFINIGRVGLPVGGNLDGSNLGFMWVALLYPEDASVFLGTSQGNRHISKNTVARYVRDMRSGDWDPTHQGPAFDVNGHLIDGHHTCHAIIEYGEPVKVGLHFNCVPCSVYKLDFGRGRDAKDVLVRLDIFKNARMAASTSRAAILGCAASSGRITNPEVVAVAEMYKDQIEWMLRECGGRLKAPLYGAILRAVVYYGDDNPRITEFCNHLRDGTNGGASCPVTTLQKYLASAAGPGKTIRTDHSVLYPRVLKALDAFRRGQKFKSFRQLPTKDIWPFDVFEEE